MTERYSPFCLDMTEVFPSVFGYYIDDWEVFLSLFGYYIDDWDVFPSLFGYYIDDRGVFPSVLGYYIDDWEVYPSVFGYRPKMPHNHDDVMTGKHFPYYWVLCTHWSPVDSFHKKARNAEMVSLLLDLTRCWTKSQVAGELRCQDCVTVMNHTCSPSMLCWQQGIHKHFFVEDLGPSCEFPRPKEILKGPSLKYITNPLIVGVQCAPM